MSNILRIRTLTERFFEGETTLSEEQELYAFYSEHSDLPDDLAQNREFFLDLAAVRCVAEASPQKKRLWLGWAAAVIVLLVGGATTFFALKSQTEEEYVAYIYGERVTDPAVVLSEMQRTMAVVSSDDGDIVEEQLKSMFVN